MQANIEYSIIIPTYQRKDSVLRLLTSIDKSSESFKNRSKIEVVIVIDGSTDGTHEALIEANTSLSSEIIFQQNSGSSAARNAGINIAKGDHLWLLDDDMVIDEKALNTHLTVTSNHNLMTLGQILTIGPNSLLLIELTNYYNKLHLKLIECQKNIIDPFLVSTANLSGPKHLFTKYLFDTSFRNYGFEDHELVYRMMLDGIKFEYAAEATATQHYDHSYKQFLSKIYQEGQNKHIMWGIHPELKSTPLIQSIDPMIKLINFLFLSKCHKLLRVLKSLLFFLSDFKYFPTKIRRHLFRYTVSAYRLAGLLDAKNHPKI